MMLVLVRVSPLQAESVPILGARPVSTASQPLDDVAARGDHVGAAAAPLAEGAERATGSGEFGASSPRSLGVDVCILFERPLRYKLSGHQAILRPRHQKNTWQQV
jgi:hypothetical protein